MDDDWNFWYCFFLLSCFNEKLIFQDRKILLFHDNTSCHPESVEGKFSDTKIILLPKITTSSLQPLDAENIQIFNFKYKKSLATCILYWINENVSASNTIKDVDILMTIKWEQQAWKDVLPWMVKRCFEKCGSRKIDADLMEDDEKDPEFSAHV